MINKQKTDKFLTTEMEIIPIDDNIIFTFYLQKQRSQTQIKQYLCTVQALTTVSSVRWLEVAEIFSCKKTRKTYLEKKKILRYQIKFPE
jgi:hypothetical protein